MNELIKVNYDGEQPLVSGRELHEFLEPLNSFEEFFVCVSALKIQMNRAELGVLSDVMDFFFKKFSPEAVSYLKDSIIAERALPCSSPAPRKFSEKNYMRMIISGFASAFPAYTLVGSEVPICGVGRIDILANERVSNRPVIIELKIGNKNPNAQLIAYGNKYRNPILIGVTESPLDDSRKISFIKYYTYSQIIGGDRYGRTTN